MNNYSSAQLGIGAEFMQPELTYGIQAEFMDTWEEPCLQSKRLVQISLVQSAKLWIFFRRFSGTKELVPAHLGRGGLDSGFAEVARDAAAIDLPIRRQFDDHRSKL